MCTSPPGTPGSATESLCWGPWSQAAPATEKRMAAAGPAVRLSSPSRAAAARGPPPRSRPCEGGPSGSRPASAAARRRPCPRSASASSCRASRLSSPAQKLAHGVEGDLALEVQVHVLQEVAHELFHRRPPCSLRSALAGLQAWRRPSPSRARSQGIGSYPPAACPRKDFPREQSGTALQRHWASTPSLGSWQTKQGRGFRRNCVRAAADEAVLVRVEAAADAQRAVADDAVALGVAAHAGVQVALRLERVVPGLARRVAPDALRRVEARRCRARRRGSTRRRRRAGGSRGRSSAPGGSSCTAPSPCAPRSACMLR